MGADGLVSGNVKKIYRKKCDENVICMRECSDAMRWEERSPSVLKINVQISQSQWFEFQRLQSCLGLSADQVVEHALMLLAWVVKERREGRMVMGFQSHPPTVQLLDMPDLNRVQADVDVDATSLTQLPQMIAEEMRCLVEEGRIDEAIEVADVEKRLDRACPSPLTETHPDPKRVQSAMILEAAKVMAEEGEPATAVRLIKEVRKQKSH